MAKAKFGDEYREARKKFDEEDDFKSAANYIVKELQGEADLNDPDIIRHLESFRAELVASMLVEYWRIGVKIPMNALVGVQYFPGLGPLTEDEILCAVKVLKDND